ncbi:MAG: hypothetical protein OXK82_03120 [Deltaproteobacteria bacterium]|nr:hypothetical protein [Deltaproteobacteria bacterium]
MALIVASFLTIFYFGTPPLTAKAVFADVVLGLLLAVAGVWVVGGMFEWKTTLYDVGIKAGGGIAIALLVALYVRPVYFATSFGPGPIPPYAESITLAPWEPIGVILDVYEEQFNRSRANAIHLVIPDDIRKQVWNFRAERPDVKAVYQANWGFPRRSPKLRVLDQIEERQDCLSFEEKDGKVYAALVSEELKTVTRPTDKATIYLCKH